MRSLIRTEAGIFCPLPDGGYLLTTKDEEPGEFEIGAKIMASTMLQTYEVKRDGRQVGFFLDSAFRTLNKGGALVTYLESKRGKATSSSVIFRHPDLVIFDIDRCGSMAISTRVNERISSILNEQ